MSEEQVVEKQGQNSGTEPEQKPEYSPELSARRAVNRKHAELMLEKEKTLRLQTRVEELQSGKGVEPKREDFDDEDGYTKELVQHEVKKVIDGGKHSGREAEIRQMMDENVSKGCDKYDDFLDVLSKAEDIPASNELCLAILESPVSHDLNYYLATHKEEAGSLNKMSVGRQLTELGKIEERLNSGANSRKITKAPAPVDELRGAGGSNPVRDVSKMSVKEQHAQWRQDAIRAEGGR